MKCMRKILIADDEHKIVMTLEYTFRKMDMKYLLQEMAQKFRIIKRRNSRCNFIRCNDAKCRWIYHNTGNKKTRKTEKLQVVFYLPKPILVDIEKD